ncbi:MAG: rubrerythrin [Desulfuromonas sp.]|nr:MAG: rubrerythrin [Desulfuromonas sp.]
MTQVNLQEAIKDSIQTEKDAMDFYQLCAERSQDEKAAKSFEILAKEEREHAHQFYRIYPGTDLPAFETLIVEAPRSDSPWLADLNKMIGHEFDEQRALQLAMDKEEELEKYLREMAAKIDDGDVKKVYLSNASSTHGHFELIRQDYEDIYGA